MTAGAPGFFGRSWWSGLADAHHRRQKQRRHDLPNWRVSGISWLSCGESTFIYGIEVLFPQLNLSAGHVSGSQVSTCPLAPVSARLDKSTARIATVQPQKPDRPPEAGRFILSSGTRAQPVRFWRRGCGPAATPCRQAMQVHQPDDSTICRTRRRGAAFSLHQRSHHQFGGNRG